MRKALSIVIISILCLLPFSLFTVYETDRGMITQLGKLETDSDNSVKIYMPGLHVRIPFIQEYKNFDLREKILDIQSSRITTLEKKDVLVDFYVLWNIDNLPLYYTRTGGNKAKAEQLLQQKVVAALKAEFGKYTISEAVHGERAELMSRLKEATDDSTKNIGITITDVRIKRIDLPDEVRDSVYARMRAERERVASEIRATGSALASKICAIAEREQRIILAEALRTSNEIRGEGDAHAINLYSNAYSKDQGFFDFYRSTLAYKNIFNNKNDLLILNPDDLFFKHFSIKNNK
ncbi:MAG TPA: protease modulator HflC [Candidatus Azosocius sp. HAIN]